VPAVQVVVSHRPHIPSVSFFKGVVDLKTSFAAWRSRLRFPAAVVFATIALAGLYAGYLQLSGNFHTVIAGEFYRSAQPSSEQLADYVKAHGIKTVINLRGQNDNASWYVQEREEAARLGVQHIDFRMSASKILSPAQADELVAIMRSAPKPILVHCLSGADRTGLVSVIYSQKVAGIDEEVAERQLSFYYGHLGIPYLSSAYAMDRSWQGLETHFGLREG
jgi:protein tyrosine/serine phosphatase